MRHLAAKLFFVITFFFSGTSFSQSLSKGEFRQMFTQGNLMILEGYYDTAVKIFLQLNTSDPSNANVNYKTGYCYLHIAGEKTKAIPYLENAIKQTSGAYQQDEPTEKNAPEDAIYYLGQAYHYAYRFDEAIAHLTKYRDIIGKWNLKLVKEVDHWNEMSKSAKELTASPVECRISNLGDSVNCQYADYSPVISADESILAFTSRRLGTGGSANRTISNEFLEDIWICNRGPYGTWTKARSISRTINTNENEATIGLSADGQQLYVYRDDKGDGNIYLSTQDGNFWNSPVKIGGSVNSKKWEPSACVSADGSTMYFVSDRQGGMGGRDIYQCHKLSNQTWSEPENLGPAINTAFDEDAPFIHPDGTTFFFSSTGHNTMGGFDIFYSTKVANNVWAKPTNIGYPINTTGDDIYFVTSSDGRRAYYASLRPEGKGEKDIYMISMPKAIVKSVAILVGYLKNRDGSPIPKNALVTTKAATGKVVLNTPNEASGKFVQSLFPGQTYEITVEANGNKVFTDKFFLPEDSSYQELGRGFFQQILYIGDRTNVFSAQKVLDTTSKTEIIPMDGKILLSQNADDVAKNLAIQLLNSQGNIIASTVTDEKGRFNFQNISSEQKYMIKIDENDPFLKNHSQFYLASKEGKIVLPSNKENKFFLFKNVSPEINKLNAVETDDPLLSKSAMSGKLSLDDKGKKALANATVFLLDEKGKTIQQKTTDPSGRFTFEHIPGDNNYTISIKDNDPSLLNKQKIYLSNQHEVLVRTMGKTGDYFVFENLPADLNKMSTIDMADNTKLITMSGKVLGSNNKKDGVANLEINLLDKHGKVIQQTQTDASGAFRFEKLSGDNSYTVRLNELDPQLAGLTNAFLSNEKDKVIGVVNLSKKENSFRNIPANLMQLAELKDVYLTSSRKDDLSLINHKTVIYPGDEKFDFVIYFPYNKKEINISVGSFVSLTERVAQKIADHGKAMIVIAASSSSVPTSSFPSNELLSESRANEIKEKIQTAMSQKKIDVTNISYDITNKVQGPEYKNDAMQNRKEYEKWQFVKVIVK